MTSGPPLRLVPPPERDDAALNQVILALIRIMEPGQRAQVIRECARRSELMRDDTSGCQSVYEDLLSGRWKP